MVIVYDLAVLVVEREHPRYGQIGCLTGHDLIHSGTYFVKFPDSEKEESIPDCLEMERSKRIAETFYRIRDDEGKKFDLHPRRAGPLSFIEKFLELNVGNLEVFVSRYKRAFEEDFI